MLPSFGDDALEQARYALSAVDRTPATSELLDVIQTLLECATNANDEYCRAQRAVEAAEAELLELKRQIEAAA